jgi:WD40 repeat protein
MRKSPSRFWLRFRSRLETICQCAESSEPCPAYVQNVSRGGLGLLSPQRFEPGTIIKVRKPAGDDEFVFISARVVYSQPTSDGKWTMGCAFDKELNEAELGAWLKPKTENRGSKLSQQETLHDFQTSTLPSLPSTSPVVSDSVPQVEVAERKGPLSSLGVKKTIPSPPSTGEISRDGSEPMEEVASFRGHRGPVNTVAFSSDRKVVVSAGQDGGIKLWSFSKTSTFEPIPYNHPGGVQVLALASDGKKLVSAAAKPEGVVRLWDLSSAKPRFKSQLQVPKAPVESLALSSDGNVLAIACDKTILLWDLTKASVREACILRGHDQAITSLAFTSDNRILASGSQDGTARLWSTEFSSARELAGLESSRAAVLSVAFSPDSGAVAFGSQDHTVNVWDITGNKPLEEAQLRGHGDAVRSVLFPPDGQTLISVDSKNEALLWDVPSATPIRQWSIPGGTTVASVACTQDGRYLATGTMGIITVFRLYPKPKTSPAKVGK